MIKVGEKGPMLESSFPWLDSIQAAIKFWASRWQTMEVMLPHMYVLFLIWMKICHSCFRAELPSPFVHVSSAWISSVQIDLTKCCNSRYSLSLIVNVKFHEEGEKKRGTFWKDLDNDASLFNGCVRKLSHDRGSPTASSVCACCCCLWTRCESTFSSLYHLHLYI